MTLTSESYLWFKTLHIIGVVVWFAGLFYLVRLFIYHSEAQELEPDLRKAFSDQYLLMEKRLANIITTPGMILTVLMAIGLLISQPSWLSQGWMQVKLLLVAALLVYHFFWGASNEIVSAPQKVGFAPPSQNQSINFSD